jgi:hypothetical protein
VIKRRTLTPLISSACPGAQIAQSIMFIFAATVLSVFNIEKVTINGVVQEPKNEFSSGVLVYVLSVLTSFATLTLPIEFAGVRSHSKACSSHAPPRQNPSSGRSTFLITKLDQQQSTLLIL